MRAGVAKISSDGEKLFVTIKFSTLTIDLQSCNLYKKHFKKQLKTNRKMEPINSVNDFKGFSEKFQQENGKPFAYGIGIVFKNSAGHVIGYVWYSVNKNENPGVGAAIMHSLQMNKEYLFANKKIYLEISTALIDKILNEYLHVFNDSGNHPNIDALKKAKVATEKNSRVEAVVIFYAEEETLKKQITGIEDGAFRLALVAQSKYKKYELCLERVESIVPKLAWTKKGPRTQHHWDKIKAKSKQNPIIDRVPPENWEIPFFKEEEKV